MTDTISGYRLDDFLIDLRNRQLWRGKELIPLNSKYFDVLVFLLTRPNQLVTRQQLFEQIWRDVIVTDWALSQCIKDIRKALRDNAAHPRYIKTIPKHGFMFLRQAAPVQLGETPFPKVDAMNTFSRRPYKFLDFYREEDAEYFFGRESEIEVICSKIVSHRCFVLYGRSGVGKSSLTHAGLLPALKKKSYGAMVITSYQNPLLEIKNSLMRLPSAGSESKSEQKSASISVNKRREVIYLFDQFEEFFTITPLEIRKEFKRELGNFLAGNQVTMRLVFTIREDFLAEMNFFKDLFPEIFHHEYRLQRLEPEQAIKAIMQPAEKYGLVYESQLVEQIVQDLLEHGLVDPPQLQIVCDTLFDQRDSFSHISLQSYQKLGGAAGILSRYIKRVFDRFRLEEIELAKSILMNLVSVNGRRLLLPVSQLESQLSDRYAPASRIRQAMEDLAQARLLRFRIQDGQAWIELTHDFLIPEISSWMTTKELDEKKARSLLVRAMENFEAHQLLLDPDAIDVILPLGEQLNMTPDQAELLLKSLFNCGKTVPHWLVLKAPSAENLIMDAVSHGKPEIRLSAIQSTIYIQDPRLLKILKVITLWDTNWQVRRLASKILIEKYKDQGLVQILKRDQDPSPGLIRRAISVAFVRDQQPDLIQLWKVPPVIRFVVIGGLAWIRLHRQKTQIWQHTRGGSLGAALAGLVMGVILGMLLIYLRQTPLYESLTLLLTLSSLGVLSGFIGGIVVSFGMSAVQYIGYRHNPHWSILGATAGGLFIGALMHVIGVDTLFALFGQRLQGIAGAYEGGLIGLGLSSGRLIGERFRRKWWWFPHVLSALGAMIAALILTLIQGNLFSASIETIAHSFAQSQIKLETLAMVFGESHFGQISRLILGATEGFLFGGFLSLGMDGCFQMFNKEKKNFYPRLHE